MKIGLCLVGESMEESKLNPLIETLQSLGHNPRMLTLSEHDAKRLEELSAWSPDLVFLQGASSPSTMSLLGSITHLPIAGPSFHTMAILDHPLFWRRMLEREGVPVQPWVVVESGRNPGRDPRVSVLGFPLLIVAAHPVQGMDAYIASDRGELDKYVTALREKNPDILVGRHACEGTYSLFLNVDPSGALIADTGNLDDRQIRLMHTLCEHIDKLLELRGPCRIDLAWYPDRLQLEGIETWLDLTPQGIFQYFDCDYEDFIDGVVKVNCRLKVNG